MKTLLDIELAIDACNRGSDTQLNLPAKLSFGGGFGLQAAVIQLIITWARRNAQPTLGIASQESELFQRIHGTLAAYFSARVVDRAGSTLQRQQLLQQAAGRVEAMFQRRYVNTEKGQVVALMCIGGALREFLPTFYENSASGSRLRDISSFLSEFERVCEVVLAARARSVPKPFISAAGALVYELFKNTHEHGLRDEAGNQYERHCRGLLVRYIRLSRAELVAFCGDDQGLLRYVAKTYLAKTSLGASADFLEVSVLDSGPGLARRWISARTGFPLASVSKISLSEEREAVTECFLRHSTSKQGSSWGIGLTQVSNALARLEGFLRLRTGRLCLYASPGHADIDAPLKLHDWFPRFNVAEAEGATYSIILPVSLRAKEIK